MYKVFLDYTRFCLIVDHTTILLIHNHVQATPEEKVKKQKGSEEGGSRPLTTPRVPSSWRCDLGIKYHILFIPCENQRFFKCIGWSCVLFCLYVCLFAGQIAYMSQFQTDLHETSPCGRVCRKQEAYCFWGQKGKRSTSAKFLKLSIFIRLTLNLKRSCIFGHLIQPQIILKVKFVSWISQVSCYARHRSCLFGCPHRMC